MLLGNRTLSGRNGSVWRTLVVCALVPWPIGNGSTLTSLDSSKETEHPFQTIKPMEGQHELKLKEVIHVYKEPSSHSTNINGETATQNRTRRSEAEAKLKQEDLKQEKKLKDIIKELDRLEEIDKATTEYPSLRRFKKSQEVKSETQNKTFGEANRLIYIIILIRGMQLAKETEKV